LNGGWLTAAAAVAPVAQLDSARVFAVRDQVLRDPEFNVGQDWRTRLIDWFVENLESFAKSLPMAARIFGMIVVATILLLVLWWLVPAVGARMRRSARTSPTANLPLPALGFAAAESAARTAFAEGRLKECVRAVWLGTLALLEQGGLSPARRARTDWEHVRAASRLRPDLEPVLTTLAIGFQRTHFGRAIVERDEAASCLERLGDLQRSISQAQTIPDERPRPEVSARG
jgi:hypothetical protein